MASESAPVQVELKFWFAQNTGLALPLSKQADNNSDPEFSGYAGSLVYESDLIQKQIISHRPKHKSIQELEKEHPNYKTIHELLNKISTLDIQEIIQLKKLISEMENHVMSGLDFMVQAMYPTPEFYKGFYDKCNQRLEELAPEYYRVIIEMDEAEELNGYQLYTCSHHIYSFDNFLSDIVPAFESYKKVPEMTKEEFIAKFEDMACTDWSKMDEHGECYGGFWKYPEGSYERTNAYTLSRETNREKLWELPYPKSFVLKTIEFGCSNRQESVRFSNFICEWARRKYNGWARMKASSAKAN